MAACDARHSNVLIVNCCFWRRSFLLQSTLKKHKTFRWEVTRGIVRPECLISWAGPWTEYKSYSFTKTSLVITHHQSISSKWQACQSYPSSWQSSIWITFCSFVGLGKLLRVISPFNSFYIWMRKSFPNPPHCSASTRSWLPAKKWRWTPR